MAARASIFILAVLLGACPRPASTDEPAHRDPPVAPAGPVRLVVLLVIDQLPQWAFAEKRPHLARGFDRLLREGEWHVGEYPTPATLTAPGHALLGTGEPPARSGILGNTWWDRDEQRLIASVRDPAGGTSPARLRVPGLGDAVRAGGGGRKAVGISLKERAAILPLGHAGLAVWYDKKRVAFRGNEPRDWIDAHARQHPIAPRLAQAWTPLDPARLAALSGRRDHEPGEVGAKGFGPTFPHAPTSVTDPADALFAVPLGNEVVFEIAEAALSGEALGRDDAPDLLVLSMSAHDYAGHGWGQESWEAWDMLLRLDERLGLFLDRLDTAVGPGRWSMIVTSDHGASPLPERVGGGRISYPSLLDAANRAAIAKLGPGTWVSSARYPHVHLSATARALPKRDRDAMLDKVMLALRAFPGIARVGRSADFMGNCEARAPDAAAICEMLDPERSGEAFFLPHPGWIFEDVDEPLATGHGSFHDYDRQVPLLLVPPGRRPHDPLAGPSGTLVPIAEVSTTIAGWLGVPPPRTLR
jgi:predicted AlkP superfamily pyrophosphatase or phosphodiesterase